MTSLFTAQPVISADRAQIYIHDCSLLGQLAPRYNNTLAIAADSDLAVVFVAQDRKGGTEDTPFIAISVYILTTHVIAYI
jgi:hypothetical protein